MRAIWDLGFGIGKCPVAGLFAFSPTRPRGFRDWALAPSLPLRSAGQWSGCRRTGIGSR